MRQRAAEAERPLRSTLDLGHNLDPVSADLVQILIAARALVDAADNKGYTPLHLAASAGNLEAAELLITAGANLEAVDIVDGQTPLKLAKQARHRQMIDLLLAQVRRVSLKSKGEWPDPEISP